MVFAVVKWMISVKIKYHESVGRRLILNLILSYIVYCISDPSEIKSKQKIVHQK